MWFDILVFVFMYGESKLSARGGSVCGKKGGRKRVEDIFGSLFSRKKFSTFVVVCKSYYLTMCCAVVYIYIYIYI